MAKDRKTTVLLLISGLFLCCHGFYIQEPEAFEPFDLLCELFKKNITSISDIPENLKPTYFKAIDQCKNFYGLEKQENPLGNEDKLPPKQPADASIFDYEGPVMVIKSEWIQVIPLIDEYPIDDETTSNHTDSTNNSTLGNQRYLNNNTQNTTESFYNHTTYESYTPKENSTLTVEPVYQNSWNSSSSNDTYYGQNISESYNRTNSDSDQETENYPESITITEGDKKKLEYEPYFEDWPPKSPLSYEYSKAYYPNSNQIPYEKYHNDDEYSTNSIQSPSESAVSY